MAKSDLEDTDIICNHQPFESIRIADSVSGALLRKPDEKKRKYLLVHLGVKTRLREILTLELPGGLTVLKRPGGVVYDTALTTGHKRPGGVVYDTIQDYSNYFI
ncbi:hypothetical protein ACFE04_019758 [Oxalis oulophora]